MAQTVFARTHFQAPMLRLPAPSEPILSILFPRYSAEAERRQMEAAAKKHMEGYFAGRIIDHKLDLILFGKLLYTAEGYKRWLEYMIVLHDGPSVLQASPATTVERAGVLPAAATTSAVNATQVEAEPVATSPGTIPEVTPTIRAEAARGYLSELVGSVKIKVHRLKEARETAELLGRLRDQQQLDAILRDVNSILEDLTAFIRNGNTERKIDDVSALLRKIEIAIQRVADATAKKAAAPVASSRNGPSTAIPGLVHLVGDLYAELDATALTALRTTYGANVEQLFQTALNDGIIPMFGTGESGIKLKAPYELKVRRTNLEAYAAPGTLRLIGAVQNRNVNGRTIKVIVFGTLTIAHTGGK